MTKMTYIDALNVALSALTAEKYTNGDATINGDELREKLTALRDAQIKRNSSDKQTKKQKENGNLEQLLYAGMLEHEGAHSVSQWKELLGAPFSEMNPQKVAPLMKKLVDAGKVERLIEKRVSLFRIAD